jgi:hypothetical protein
LSAADKGKLDTLTSTYWRDPVSDAGNLPLNTDPVGAIRLVTTENTIYECISQTGLLSGQWRPFATVAAIATVATAVAGTDNSSLMSPLRTMQLITALALAPLASPALTGTPTAPTPAACDNSTKLATTAFVKEAVAPLAPLASPALTGTPTAPTPAEGDNSTNLATTAFVQEAVAPLAPLESPALTGTPTAPTSAEGDNSTNLATTAFVQEAIAPLAPLESPALTGTPTAPSPAAGDNSANLATTAFVQGAIPPVASEADAQAGTDNAKIMTALCVAEAIAALAPRVANWTSPNRLVDAHTGWKLGDIVYDEGLGGQQVAAVTVNSGFPGDGNDHDIEFYFYDTDQAGSSFASGSLYYSVLSSDVDQNQLASDLANAITSNIWFVTASATGNVVTITWNNAGTFNNEGGTSYYFYSENEGWGYPAEISDTVVIPGTAPSVSGLYEIADMGNLGNPNGYAVLLSAIPAPNLSNPGPIGASTPSSANFTTLTVGDGGYGDYPLVATGNIDVNNLGADWGIIRLRATAYGASSYAAWNVGMVGNGYGGTRGTFIIAIDGGDIHFKIDPSSHALYLGVTSTGLMGLLSGVVTYACPSIAANGATQTITMNITGATTSSTVIITPINGNLPAGVLVTGRVTATNTVTLTFTNVTTGAITPPSLQYRATVFNF